MHSYDPTFPLFPTFSLLACLFCIIPLPWHLQAWNAGTCAFMLWTSSVCLTLFINSLLWAGKIDNLAPIWCDISTQVILGAGVGIPASSLCISRRLYKITNIQNASLTWADKRRAVFIDLCIAVGLPIFVLLLHIIVQPHRYDIYEDIGCFPVTYATFPAYLLYYMWVPLMGVISFIYSCMTLRTFWQRRAQFSTLVSTNSGMNPSRYFRLMLLAITDILCTIPLGTYVMFNANAGQPLRPWISWADTHFDFWRIVIVPAIFWRSNPKITVALELTRWLPVFSGFVFFALFGFAGEAKKHYSIGFWWLAKRLNFKKPSPEKHPLSKTSWKMLPSWASLPRFSSSSSDSNTISGAKKPPHLSLSSSFGMDFEVDYDLESGGVPPSGKPPAYERTPSPKFDPDCIEIKIQVETETDLQRTPTRSLTPILIVPRSPTRDSFANSCFSPSSLTTISESSDRDEISIVISRVSMADSVLPTEDFDHTHDNDGISFRTTGTAATAGTGPRAI